MNKIPLPMETEMHTSENPVKVLIADSQYLITESIKVILQHDVRFDILGVVIGKCELMKTLNEEKVDMLIIDHYHIDIGGIAELKEIKTDFPDLKMLVVTNSINKAEFYELKSIGVKNILLKSTGKEEFTDAITSVLNGNRYYSDELLDLLFEVNEGKNDYEETVQLTGSELEIVKLISDGLKTKEIASLKFVSFHTVISHRKNIFRKLNVTSVSELIMYAIKAGWINTIEYHI